MTSHKFGGFLTPPPCQSKIGVLLTTSYMASQKWQPPSPYFMTSLMNVPLPIVSRMLLFSNCGWSCCIRAALSRQPVRAWRPGLGRALFRDLSTGRSISGRMRLLFLKLGGVATVSMPSQSPGFGRLPGGLPGPTVGCPVNCVTASRMLRTVKQTRPVI